MHNTLLTILLVLSSLTIYAQQFVSRIDPGGPVRAIRGMIVDDDVFLVLDRSNKKDGDGLCYLIRADGKNIIVDMSEIQDKPLLAGIKRNDSTEFYFVELQNKKSFLKSWAMSNDTGKGSLRSGQVEIPGTVYGSYVENGLLFLICSLKKDFLLKLIGIRGSDVVATSSFPLSFDLGKLKESTVSFYSDGDATMNQLMLPTKIIKQGDNLWIISDESPRMWQYSDNPPSTFRTTVIRINILTGKTLIRSYFEKTRDEFSTTAHGNDIYRLTQSYFGERRIDHYSFDDNKLIVEQMISPARQDTTIRRAGTRKLVAVNQIASDADAEVWGVFLIVDSMTTTGQKIVTCGFFAQGSRMPVIAPIHVLGLASFAVTLSSLVIRDLSEGYSAATYFYITPEANQRFKVINAPPLVQQSIDEYELLMQGSKGYTYKGYMRHGDTAFWVYQRNKESPVEVVKFQR